MIDDKVVFVSELATESAEAMNGAGGAASEAGADEITGIFGAEVALEAVTDMELPANRIGRSRAISNNAAVNLSTCAFFGSAITEKDCFRDSFIFLISINV